MIVVVNRLQLAYDLKNPDSDYLSKKEMEAILDSPHTCPSFLSIPYGDSSPKSRQLGATYALKEFMARTCNESDFLSLINSVKSN